MGPLFAVTTICPLRSAARIWSSRGLARLRVERRQLDQHVGGRLAREGNAIASEWLRACGQPRHSASRAASNAGRH